MVSKAGLHWHYEGKSHVQVSIMFKVSLLVLALPLSLYLCALRVQTTNASITGRLTEAAIGDAKVKAVNRSVVGVGAFDDSSCRWQSVHSSSPE